MLTTSSLAALRRGVQLHSAYWRCPSLSQSVYYRRPIYSKHDLTLPRVRCRVVAALNTAHRYRARRERHHTLHDLQYIYDDRCCQNRGDRRQHFTIGIFPSVTQAPFADAFHLIQVQWVSPRCPVSLVNLSIKGGQDLYPSDS